MRQVTIPSTTMARENTGRNWFAIDCENQGWTPRSAGIPRGDEGIPRGDGGIPRGDEGISRPARSLPCGEGGIPRGDVGIPRGYVGIPRGDVGILHPAQYTCQNCTSAI